jgi:hypothetical protein
MATRIAWWLNLDANLELEAPRRYVRRPQLEARTRALRERMGMLLRPEDVVLEPPTRAAALPGVDLAMAFCPTPSAIQALAACGFAPPPAPPVTLLREVTRRGFAPERLGQTLPGARYVRDMSQLEAALRAPCASGEWLLKRDFSFAGRERRRVRGGQLDASTAGFARRSFARAQGLQVEPYVERAGDFAQHGYLLASGELLLAPALLQHCDARGVWCGSTALPPAALSASELAALADSVRAAGAALHAAGYFGPFGVDAFRYQSAQGLAFQPRSEINPRFTMGFPRELLEHALIAVAG